jgi:hypothetical protein
MSDVGLEALQKIHKELLIDEEWTERGERVFAWVGHRLRQTVKASKVFEDGGAVLSRLSAETVVVEEVTAAEENVLRVLSELNKHALGSAYSYAATEATIVATAGAYVHADTFGWRTPQFAGYVIAQLAIAETEADYLADRTGGHVAARKHETHGMRKTADDMLNVLEDVFAAEGRARSKFENAFEFETIADIARGSPRVATLGGVAKGIALETAFGEETSLAIMRTDSPHRRIGHGLAVELRLPMNVTREEADRIADYLNRMEALGDVDTLHYGAWYCDERPDYRRSIAYRMFLPNRFYLAGISQDASYCCVGRARWADRVLNGVVSEAKPWELLAKRIGHESDEE